MADNLSILEKITELRQKIVELESKTVELTEEEDDLLRESESTLQKLVKIQENRLKLALGTKQAELELSKTFSSQAADLSSISTIYKGLTASQTQSLNVVQKTLTSVQQSLLADETKKQILDSTISGVTDLQSLQQKLAETGPEDLEVQQSIRDSYNAQLNQLKENIVAKQTIGELTEQEATALLKVLDTQKKSLSIAEKYATVSGDTKDFLQSQIDAYKGIEKTIRGVLNTAKVLSSTVGGVVGISLIGAATVGKKLLETSRQLGGNLMSMQNISTTIFGTVFEDAVGATKSLSKEFGGLNDVSLKTQLNTNVISTNLGISTGEAASLIGNFSRLNDGSTAVAEDMIATTKELALQNGLVPSDVMADVASNAEAFALYGKDGGKNIAQAAIAAGKLGVGMDKLTGITDNLLDFETSINAELELGAMLGKNINLDRARALAYEGNIGGAVQETLASLGGIEEFNKMDYFSKKKAAELLGLSVDEFQKMAANADKLNEDGTIQVSQYEQNVELLKSMGSQALTLVQSLGTGVIALGQMGGGLSSLKGTLGNVTEGFKSIFGKDSLSQARKTFSDKQIASGFGGKKAKDMLASKMGDATSKLPLTPKTGDVPTKLPQTSMSDSANPAKKGGMMDSMSKINMNAVLKGAAALVIVAAAVFVFGKAVQEFMKVSWEAVGMAVVSMLALVGAVALLGAIMSSGVGAVAILAGAAAMLVVAASVLVLGIALQQIGKGFEMLSTGISTLVPNLTSVGSTISSLVTFIPAIGLLSLALMGLSASLMALGVAGLVAMPGLMALAGVGAIAVGVGSLLGFGDEGGEGTEGGGDTALLEEIRGLRADLSGGKVAVYMDGQKVTAAVSKVVDRIGSNSYAV